MKKLLLFLTLAIGCGHPLTPTEKDMIAKQASWEAEKMGGASLGCLYPLEVSEMRGSSAKCYAFVERGTVIERYELLCNTKGCWNTELVSCRVQ